MKRSFFLLALLFSLFVLPLQSRSQDIATITQAQLADLIKQNSGKIIMLNFFATWCPPCKVEMPELVKLRNEFSPDKLVIIGLSVDEDKAAVPEFAQKIGVNYPIYMAGKDVTNVYDIKSVPHNAFYAQNGKLVISEPGLADLDILKQIVNSLEQNVVK